ncbi:MAG: hypothetical protein WCD44_01365 [Candidatus Babeliales bacterium]
MITKFNKVVLLFFVYCLCSCGKLVKWGESNFYQGEELLTEQPIVQQYIRSTTVYDQFTTCAIFDALWLSDEVRGAYADLYAVRYGKNEEQKKVFLRRQLEENRHFITFYVLSLYEVPLGDSTAEWSLFLNIDNENYIPTEIKSIDLAPEYIEFFGKKFTRFKVAYQVKFDAQDIEDNLLLSPDVGKFSLCFRSVNKGTKLTWQIYENMNVLVQQGAKQ